MLYWNEKEDLVIRTALGGVGDLTEVYPIAKEGVDATYLRKKGVSGGTLDCTFIIIHPENPLRCHSVMYESC